MTSTYLQWIFAEYNHQINKQIAYLAECIAGNSTLLEIIRPSMLNDKYSVEFIFQRNWPEIFVDMRSSATYLIIRIIFLFHYN